MVWLRLRFCRIAAIASLNAPERWVEPWAIALQGAIVAMDRAAVRG
ncbi:hypothetical protein [Lyngbya confervoides]|uniref:Uncharacterized protein n=1 Tax=Lyngbya confervoides BDU141951 TaxID=1574623 RepID=A0ABD4T2R8_9CYAN|nr:hypothetical protein [Lyngbya confervoides]MCM1982995.1 hypothetical protein [Lyngbya confervoides BDU141951]MCM1982998.1 hypothetical protein [Lyngbya confervoides BDU141951]